MNNIINYNYSNNKVSGKETNSAPVMQPRLIQLLEVVGPTQSAAPLLHPIPRAQNATG